MPMYRIQGLKLIVVRTCVLIFGLGTLFLAVACEKAPRHAVLEWIEPVKLEAGSTVEIRRHVEMWHERASAGGFSSSPVYKSSSIELEPASPEFPIWDAPLVPLVLDKDPVSGEWLIVASANSCDFWGRNGKPTLPYWTFRLRKGVWYRDATPQFLIGRVANLFVDFDVTDSSSDLHSSITTRKQLQAQQPRHPRHFTKIDSMPSSFYQGCGRPDTGATGLSYLDLQKFGSLE
jgi:hypothetical protein